MLEAEYQVALGQGDILTQYELLRFAERFPSLVERMQAAEASILRDVPEIPIDWAAVEYMISSQEPIKRVLDHGSMIGEGGDPVSATDLRS